MTWQIPRAVSFIPFAAAAVLTPLAIAQCYTAATIKCCIVAKPAPNLGRTCSGPCPDVITGDPNLPFATPTTNGKDPDPNHPTCTCTWDKYKCGLFGISCVDTGTTGSGTGTGLNVKINVACSGGGPPL